MQYTERYCTCHTRYVFIIMKMYSSKSDAFFNQKLYHDICYFISPRKYMLWYSLKLPLGPAVIKLFSCSTQLSMKFALLINLKLLAIANSFLLNLAEHNISRLINLKMPTIAEKNYLLSWVEQEKCFITSGPGEIRKDITKTCLYNFDPLKPHFYIVKLGFTGVYIIFLILLKKT